MIHRTALAASLLAASVLISPARADDTKTAPPAGGPPVGKQAQEGKEGFTKGEKGGKDGMRGRATERRNPEIWRKAMDQTMPELSPETQEKVKAERAEFETQVKAWRAENGDKMKALEVKIRDARGKDQKGAPDPALMQEMQALRASMPKVEELQGKIFALLTPDQQAKFKERFDAAQKEAQIARKGDKKDGDPDPMLPGGERPGKRPNNDKPFQFDGDKPAGGGQQNGDGKPSGR